MSAEKALAVSVNAIGDATCGAVLWRMRGELRATLVVKATFALVAESDMALASPEELVLGEIHYQNNPTRSVRATSDFAPFRHRADVLFVGHAHAPGGAPVTSLAVRLGIFRGHALVDKELCVEADSKDGAPLPFVKMPLVYERAYGGIGWKDNPLGVGYPPGSAARAPNVLHPSAGDRTAGFGPISRSWPARRGLLDKAARKQVEQETPDLPDGIDWSYFQSAPADQQTADIHGNEWIVLQHLRPESPIFRSRLPDARAEGRVYGLSAASPDRFNPLDFRADTLYIDGDAGTCSLTFRAVLPLADPTRIGALRIIAGVRTRTQAIAWPDAPPPSVRSIPPPRPSAPATGESSNEETRALSPEEFVGAAVRRATPFEEAAPEDPPLAGTRALSPEEMEPGARALPFAPAPPAIAGSGASRQEGPGQARTPGAPWSENSSGPVPDATGLEATLAIVSREETPPPPSAAQFFHNLPSPARAAPDVEPSIPARKSDAIPIVTRTPLTGFTLPWSLRAGQSARIVVFKGSFDLVPGGPARIRDEADPPMGDAHVDDHPDKSLLYPSDFTIFKPKADVVLKGSAHTSSGAGRAEVRFSFGKRKRGFSRRIMVFGERQWEKAVVKLAPSEPRPFRVMPLVWENAFGGPGFDANPVGAGISGDRLPALEDPERLVKSPEDRPEPVGFGPIAMRWAARWSKIGTYGPAWRKTRWPYFPDDFDWAFFQSAPRPQQLESIDGDEPFSLAGMHPEHAVIEGSLPGLRPRCFVQRAGRAGGTFHEIALRLDTVVFDVDAMKLHLLFRGLVEVDDEAATELSELYLMLEEMSAPRATIEEARRHYEAERAPRMPIATPPEGPSNDAAPPVEDAMDAHGERLKSRLAAAGLGAAAAAAVAAPAAAAAAPSPPRRPDTGRLRKKAMELLESGRPLDGVELGGADLADLDFSGRSLKDAVLTDARLVRCRFAGANLSGAQLSGADLTDAVLEGANLDGADLAGATLEGARAARVTIERTHFDDARAERIDLRQARGQQPSFVGARMRGARLDKAEIPGADFTRANLDGASFDGASAPEIRLYDATGERSSWKNAILTDARADGVRLPRSGFASIRGDGGVWEGAVLDGASFLGATLRGASFSKASCEGAFFSGTDLSKGRLVRARLKGAAFLKANLREASFESADLQGADLRGANMYGAETWKANLAGAQLELANKTRTKIAEET